MSGVVGKAGGRGGRIFHGESRPETCRQGAPSTLHVASAPPAQLPGRDGRGGSQLPCCVYSRQKGFGFRRCCWGLVWFCFVSFRFFFGLACLFLRGVKKKVCNYFLQSSHYMSVNNKEEIL